MVGRAGVVSGRTPVALGWILPAVLLLIAVTALVTAHGFDGLYGQDAFGPVDPGFMPVWALRQPGRHRSRP